MWRKSTHLLEGRADLLAEDCLERRALLANDVDRREVALRDGDDELHADEGRADDDKLLALRDRAVDGLRVRDAAQREDVAQVRALDGQLARRTARREDECLVGHTLAGRADDYGLARHIDGGDFGAGAQDHAVLGLELIGRAPLQFGRVGHKRFAQLRPAVDEMNQKWLYARHGHDKPVNRCVGLLGKHSNSAIEPVLASGMSVVRGSETQVHTPRAGSRRRGKRRFHHQQSRHLGQWRLPCRWREASAGGTCSAWWCSVDRRSHRSFRRRRGPGKSESLWARGRPLCTDVSGNYAAAIAPHTDVTGADIEASCGEFLLIECTRPNVSVTHLRARGWFKTLIRYMNGGAQRFNSPYDSSIGGEHTLGKRCAVVSAERARRVDLVTETRQEDLSVALKGDLLPAPLVSTRRTPTSPLSTHMSPSFSSLSLSTAMVLDDILRYICGGGRRNLRASCENRLRREYMRL